jgi:hypothetical protein
MVGFNSLSIITYHFRPFGLFLDQSAIEERGFFDAFHLGQFAKGLDLIGALIHALGWDFVTKAEWLVESSAFRPKETLLRVLFVRGTGRSDHRLRLILPQNNATTIDFDNHGAVRFWYRGYPWLTFELGR